MHSSSLACTSLALFVVGGCNFGAVGERIESEEALKPGAKPYSRGTLTLAGSDYPVDVVYRSRGVSVEVKLKMGHSVLQTEEYEDSPSAFSLADAGDDRYEPAMPLLHFPMRIGDKWTWQGNVRSFGSEQPATATISTSSSNSSEDESVEVVVDLELQKRPSKAQVHRTLRFWFQAGKGLVKADIGGFSVRKADEQKHS